MVGDLNRGIWICWLSPGGIWKSWIKPIRREIEKKRMGARSASEVNRAKKKRGWAKLTGEWPAASFRSTWSQLSRTVYRCCVPPPFSSSGTLPTQRRRVFQVIYFLPPSLSRARSFFHSLSFSLSHSLTHCLSSSYSSSLLSLFLKETIIYRSVACRNYCESESGKTF